MLGNVNQTFYNSYLVVHNYQFGNSFFAQDTWRASDKLTLVYGTRYELYSPLLNRTDSFANFDATGGGALTVATGGSWANRSLIRLTRTISRPASDSLTRRASGSSCVAALASSTST